MYIDYVIVPINGFKTPKIIGYKNVEHLKQRLGEYGAVFMKTEEALELPEQIDNVYQIESTKEYGKFKKEKDCTNINNFTIISTYCNRWCICIHCHRFI